MTVHVPLNTASSPSRSKRRSVQYIILATFFMASLTVTLHFVSRYHKWGVERSSTETIPGALTEPDFDDISPSLSPHPQISDDAPRPHPLIEKPAPNFILQDTSGNTVSLSSYRGKAVIIDFWATWCTPCKVEIPRLELLRERYATQGLEVLGITEDELDLRDRAKLLEEKQDIVDSAAKLRINYPVLFDESNVAQSYGGIEALPTTFFVGRDGRIIAATIGVADKDDLETYAKKALDNAHRAPESGL